MLQFQKWLLCYATEQLELSNSRFYIQIALCGRPLFHRHSRGFPPKNDILHPKIVIFHPILTFSPKKNVHSILTFLTQNHWQNSQFNSFSSLSSNSLKIYFTCAFFISVLKITFYCICNFFVMTKNIWLQHFLLSWQNFFLSWRKFHFSSWAVNSP